MNETRDDDHDQAVVGPVTAGGGTHDVTGPDAAAHAADSHMTAAAHGGHDVATVHDAHDDQPLGPIDWPAWRAALLGIAVGAMICVLLYLAIR